MSFLLSFRNVAAAAAATNEVDERREWIAESDAYQYLQKSELPTYHFQDSLRRLPIPKLEDTCRRYLNAVRPFSTDDRFRRTERIVQDFLAQEGPELQRLLVDFDRVNAHTSYISGFLPPPLLLRSRPPSSPPHA